MNVIHHSQTGRIGSIDVFRGLTILTMIFVNDLASVRSLPLWMKHAEEGSDWMTFVDVVFPAFLFIVGMSIPFAMEKRLRGGASPSQLLRHVLSRFAGLLALGILMVNMPGLNESLTGMPRSLWSFLVFVSAILVWNSYPQTPGTWRSVSIGLRIAGVLGLLVLAYLYRGGTDHDPRWLSTSWWGILGLIGWSYLVVSGAYLILRRNLAALVACLALFVALYLGDRAGALPAIAPIKPYLWLGGHVGGHASITIAGVIVALVVGGMTEAATPPRQVLWILATGVLLAAGGYFLRPLYGISKNMATPAWSLYSAAICCVVYAILFWLVDLRGRKGWTRFFAPAGTNPLLAYILPDIVYGLLVLFGLQWYWEVPGEGLAGVARSVLFASAIVTAAGVLSRLGIRLHL